MALGGWCFELGEEGEVPATGTRFRAPVVFPRVDYASYDGETMVTWVPRIAATPRRPRGEGGNPRSASRNSSFSAALTHMSRVHDVGVGRRLSVQGFGAGVSNC
jgi:hypothetical protein